MSDTEGKWVCDFAMVLQYLLMFASGFLLKAMDETIDDEFYRRKVPEALRYALGAVVGVVFAWLVSGSIEFAGVIGAIIAANILFVKTDHLAYLFGLAVFAAGIFYFGFSGISIIAFAVLFAGAALDEKFNESKNRVLNKRPFLGVLALAVSIFFWNPAYLLAVVSFDLAYHLAEAVLGSVKVSAQKK